MQVTYRCPKCNTSGHEDVYRIGRGKDDGVYACLECWKKWAKEYKKRRKKSEIQGNYIV